MRKAWRVHNGISSADEYSPLPDRGKIYATRKTLRRCNPLTWIHMVVMWPARCCVWITSQYNSSGMWVEAFDSEKKLSPYRLSRSHCVNQNNWLQGDNNDIKASPTSMLKYKYCETPATNRIFNNQKMIWSCYHPIVNHFHLAILHCIP